jgi:hypothetical protein
MSGVFSNLGKVNTTAKASKANKKLQIEIPGIKELAMLDTLATSVEGLLISASARVKASQNEEFIKLGMKHKKAPESFQGIDPGTNNLDDPDFFASCQLRRRSSASGLTADEIALCTDYKFPMKTNVKQVGTIVINPAYAADKTILTKLEKLLAKSMEKGEIPADLFQIQDEISMQVIPENGVDYLFQNYNDEKVIATLLPVVTTPAISPKVKIDDLSVALKTFADMVSEEGGKSISALAEVVKEKKKPAAKK